MPSYLPCKKNNSNGYITYVNLISQANPFLFQTNPTLADGDVKISIDGGALNNLGTLPVVTPAGSKEVKVVLSQAETNGDNIKITFSDASGAEWCDLGLEIQTSGQTFDEMVQSIWDKATSALSTAGSIGKLLVDDINATISSRSSHSAADVWTVETRTLTSFGTLVSDIWNNATRTLTSFGTLVSDIWGNATRTLTSFGTLIADLFNTDSGETYSSAVAGSVVKEIADNAGGSSLSLDGIADAVWDEDITEHTTEDSAGAEMQSHATPSDVDASLATYDAPTRAELTTDKESIITEVDANETKIDTIGEMVFTLLLDIEAGGGGAPTVEEIDEELTTEHGDGSWKTGLEFRPD